MSELATATAQKQVEKATAPTVEDVLRAREQEIGRALGAGIDPAEFIQNAVTTLRNNPTLMKADLPSLLGALYLSAQLKLRVGGLAPQVHLTPRTVKGKLVVVPIIDYRGYLHLAHNTNRFSKIEAIDLYEGDLFTWGSSSERGRYFDITAARKTDRGKLVGVIGLAKLKNADDSIWVHLDREEIERDHRPKSWESTPWKTHETAMFRKTAIRELSKWIPNSTEMAVAAADDQALIRKVDGIDELQVTHDDGEVITAEPLDESHPDYVAPEGER